MEVRITEYRTRVVEAESVIKVADQYSKGEIELDKYCIANYSIAEERNEENV